MSKIDEQEGFRSASAFLLLLLVPALALRVSVTVVLPLICVLSASSQGLNPAATNEAR